MSSSSLLLFCRSISDQSLLSASLQEAGEHRVVPVSSLGEARAKAERITDLLGMVADFSMEEESYDMLRGLREPGSLLAGAPVTALVWYGDTRAEQAAIEYGVDDVLFKPVTPARLRLTLKMMGRLRRDDEAAWMAKRPLAPSVLLNSVMQERRGGSFQARPVFSSPAYQVNLLDESGNLRKMRALEAETIRFALAHCRGRMAEVARLLGIGRSTLYRKLEEYGIQQQSRWVQPEQAAERDERVVSV